MSLEKPQRIPYETDIQWMARKNDFRINLMEQQIAELQKIVKRLEK